MDNSKLYCVVFLDVREAFDCVLHNTITKDAQLQLFWYNRNSTKVNWFKHVIDREQQCSVNGHLSNLRAMKCGVPPLTYMSMCTTGIHLGSFVILNAHK